MEALSAGGVWLVCTSTYGTGEVPDNAKALYAVLGEQRPDLSKVRYGVVALGDSPTYPDDAAREWIDRWLESLNSHPD